MTTVLPAKPKKGQPLKTTLNNGSMNAAHDGKIGRSSGEFADAQAGSDDGETEADAGPHVSKRESLHFQCLRKVAQ